jgi:hypothetical protein
MATDEELETGLTISSYIIGKKGYEKKLVMPSSGSYEIMEPPASKLHIEAVEDAWNRRDRQVAELEEKVKSQQWLLAAQDKRIKKLENQLKDARLA